MADPAFRGFVESTQDALLIFEGCRRDVLPKITRRLQEFEKRALVVSGAVFVFSEEETGIKRWTDGLSWSPSRTLGNFLVYRELDKKSAGQSGSADDQPPAGGVDPFDEASLPESSAAAATEPVASGSRRRSMSDTSGLVPALDRARERALVGSLTSTYRFRADGLVKKTISLSGLHMIGYYKIDDVTSGRLRTPSSHAELISLEISSTFLSPSLFRVPPLVETGADGQLRYKGEPDPPMSPVTRSGSSQGFNSPSLGPTQSRPPSSESTSAAASGPGRAASPRPPPLSLSTSQREPLPPGSPHRASASLRSSSRFDPYAPARSSPNLSNYASGSTGGYPFPSQHSPNRSTFSPIPDDGPFRSTDSLGRPPLSPALPMMSSSAPSSQQQWAPHQSVGLSRTTVSDQSSGAFYQPRYAMPFPPSEAGSSGPSSGSIFAYQPPPPAPRLQHPPGRSSPPMPPYPQFLPSYSQAQPPLHQRPTSSQFQPAPQQLPPQTYVPPPPQPRPYMINRHSHSSSIGSSYVDSNRPLSSHSMAVDRPQQQLPPPPPQAQSQAPYAGYHVLNQPAYPNYPGQNPWDQRLPSGMVGGIGGEPEEARHGLGLSHGRPEGFGGVKYGLGSERTEAGLRGSVKQEEQELTNWWSANGPGTSNWPSSFKGDYS